jgi:isoleucyl-tRNA synthetase
MSANAAIKTAQEEARTAKLIGSSLQSSVILDLPEPARAIYAKYKDDLEAIFVVSSVELNGESKTRNEQAEGKEGQWKFGAEFDAPGGRAKAWVLPPREAKCPRCWRYVAPVEDELCTRCEDVVGSG